MGLISLPSDVFFCIRARMTRLYNCHLFVFVCIIRRIHFRLCVLFNTNTQFSHTHTHMRWNVYLNNIFKTHIHSFWVCVRDSYYSYHIGYSCLSVQLYLLKLLLGLIETSVFIIKFTFVVKISLDLFKRKNAKKYNETHFVLKVTWCILYV